MLDLLPWHKNQWRQLNTAIANNKLHHALLLTGPEGMGLGRFSSTLVSKLLCHAEDKEFMCGECKSCILYKAGNHPDLIVINPEEQGKQIKVEQIRELVEFMQYTNQYGKKKLAVIDPAESMNRSSSNSLLKTLEEPPPDSLLILISHQPMKLPVTIRSRCQQLAFPPVFDAETVAWLNQAAADRETDMDVLLGMAQGAPLKAVQLLELDPVGQCVAMLQDLTEIRRPGAAVDLVKIAEKWRNFGSREVLNWLKILFVQMIYVKLNQPGTGFSNPDIHLYLQEISKELDLNELVICYDRALQDYQELTGPYNLNEQGILEDMFIFWQTLGHTRITADNEC